MSIELPKLPEPGVKIKGWGFAAALDGAGFYTADQLRAFAQEAARLAMEAAVEAVDDIEEKPWYGYENPNTFQDAKWAAERAIRALLVPDPAGAK